jgi:hypothetical protein
VHYLFTRERPLASRAASGDLESDVYAGLLEHSLNLRL